MTLTKQDVLREIPLRKWGGEFVIYKDFEDVKRAVESLILDQDALGFFRKEIIARKKSMGLEDK